MLSFFLRRTFRSGAEVATEVYRMLAKVGAGAYDALAERTQGLGMLEKDETLS